MKIGCPECGSRDLRFSHVRNPLERLGTLLGKRPVRCRSCRVRFFIRMWTFSDLRYARCPRCMRMDLSLWSERNYRVSAFRLLMLQFGARPYRCEPCRCNFVSFRRRKEKFRPRKPASEHQTTKAND